MATTPMQEMTTSTKTKQASPSGHSQPDSRPRNGGKMRLPAPKNMANRAKPTTSASLFMASSRILSRTFATVLSENKVPMMPYRAPGYVPNAKAP